MKKIIAVLATLDTKGLEAAFVRDHLHACGVDVCLVECFRIKKCKTRTKTIIGISSKGVCEL